MDFWPEFLASSWGKEFVAGGIGGAAGIVSGYPLDTLRVRQQHSTSGSAFSVLRNIVSNGGPAALYRGMGAPLASVTFQVLFFFLDLFFFLILNQIISDSRIYPLPRNRYNKIICLFWPILKFEEENKTIHLKIHMYSAERHCFPDERRAVPGVRSGGDGEPATVVQSGSIRGIRNRSSAEPNSDAGGARENPASATGFEFLEPRRSGVVVVVPAGADESGEEHFQKRRIQRTLQRLDHNDAQRRAFALLLLLDLRIHEGEASPWLPDDRRRDGEDDAGRRRACRRRQLGLLLPTGRRENQTSGSVQILVSKVLWNCGLPLQERQGRRVQRIVSWIGDRHCQSFCGERSYFLCV